MAMPIPDANKSTTGQSLRPLAIPAAVRIGFRMLGAVAPAAAASLAKRLFFAPPMAVRGKLVRAPLPPGGEPFEIEGMGRTLGWTIQGRSWGEGRPVLLIHGWAGHQSQMSAMVAPLTAAGFRVIAADMPGHGESEGKLSSVVHFADALQALPAQFGPLHAIVAHSFGAAATTYALGHGLQLDRAVYFAPPSRFDSFWVRFQDGLGMSAEVRRRLNDDAEAWLGVRFDDAAPVAIAPGLKTPLLVIHDAGDREVAFEEAVELTSAWPGAALCRTEQLGHLRILRDPASLAAMVAFVADHSTATRKNLTELSSLTSTRRPSAATSC